MTEIVPSSPAILVDCEIIFFTPGSNRLTIPASQLPKALLPPCECDARIASNMQECHTLDVKGVYFDDNGAEVKLARRGKASAPVGVNFLVKKTMWTFFLVRTIARVLFDEYSAYLGVRDIREESGQAQPPIHIYTS
jgi:hypothetical protein